jgi:hypothetical protein
MRWPLLPDQQRHTTTPRKTKDAVVAIATTASKSRSVERRLDNVDFGRQVRRNFEADFLLTNGGLGPGLHDDLLQIYVAGISIRLRMMLMYCSRRTRSNRKFVRIRSDFLTHGKKSSDRSSHRAYPA